MVGEEQWLSRYSGDGSRAPDQLSLPELGGEGAASLRGRAGDSVHRCVF